MIRRPFHVKSVFLTLKQLCEWLFSISSLSACISTKWKCCIAGLSRSYSSSHTPEEAPHHAQEDGKDTLHCWPPRAPAQSTGASRTGSAGQSLHSQLASTFSSHPVSVTAGHRDTSVVDAVMKMWPAPPGPDDREPARNSAQTGNTESLNSSRTFESNQPLKSCRPTDQPNLNTLRPTKPNSTAVISDTPLTPGLVIGYGNTHLSGTECFVFPCKGGSSCRNSLYYSPYFGGFVKHRLRFPVVALKIISWIITHERDVFFSHSVCSHLPLTVPRQQTETTKSRAQAGEENPPQPPSAGHAEPAREQPEPNNLYVSPH